MIDPKKVRLMTKLAVYEEGPGKKDLRINGYSKRTYVNIKQLESVIAITAAYILAMVLYCFGIYTDIISRGLSFPCPFLFEYIFPDDTNYVRTALYPLSSSHKLWYNIALYIQYPEQL